ncbi:bifunctional 2-C-methyl-D-erythritol 4-phosphate cytidylyltransferase/2-C-methyl-D-erythritol 2,4-cyclodiphosphate synthase [Roseibium litorale]|uniref:Bifunctional enzyme IspD/IspF n=1 Tax=Roseibium litorale TaxID=2803841 RepID=A0ABR9CIW2_9HYPH|nr:bifunctional 2-C-methyl-D-erythritol 4-phosphate cytidylyltransferase/2-C-methyl-D-erythritol 2,4-cyclodiphosphate synthase [Roseibium litorale]MBD8890759.1 bifunctional 2-C-methyl-D-erythritol 4-phosphate cytidylyltransferase/2-C-methyl-D-erythritol 2,4-cyclodiphosphate synthase [Roseibium litorale]
MTKQAAALIVAAGRGSRLSGGDGDRPKQYRLLGGMPILSHTLGAFLSHPGISKTLVVIHEDDLDLYETAISALPASLRTGLLPPVTGGKTRQISVRKGLMALAESNSETAPDQVLIHDAARPFIPADVITRVLGQLDEGKSAVLAAVPVFDTLKRLCPEDGRLETVDRSHLWAAQTPQGFAFPAIHAAHLRAVAAGRNDFTDDTAVGEWDGLTTSLAEGHPDNFKITTQADLVRAEQRITMTSSALPPLSSLGDIRHGTGYDVHAFEPGDAVILGGVAIPHDRKLKGHSDADVALHALTDAILGAIADGDIGAHFPPSDPKWKGAASDQFLQDAIRRVNELGGRIAHLDVTIICEAPKIGPHRDVIRAKIAEICALPVTRVSVKATTSERLGFTGRREGIAAMASATVRLPFTGD